MKKGKLLLLIPAILIFSACTPEDSEKMIPANRTISNLETGIPQKIICYGTSLTATGDWVIQLRTTMAGKYPALVTVLNRGSIAMASDWGIENLEQKVLNENPDCVIIEFSINDAYLPYNISIEESRSNLMDMIERIIAKNKNCEIILLTMNHPLEDKFEDRPEIPEYYQVCREITDQENLILLDLYPIWLELLEDDPIKYHSFFPDGIHTTASGCREVITPEILKVFGIKGSINEKNN